MSASIYALATRVGELESCSDPGLCNSGSHNRHTPPPAFHYHMKDATDVTLGLFSQSDTLWFLPPLTKILSIPFADTNLGSSSPFVSATDASILPPWRPGRGSGVFDVAEAAHRVLVPRAAVLLEAFMRLHARDSGKQVGSFSLAMIDYMMMYVDEDGFLDVQQLSPTIKTFYEQLKQDEKPIREWTQELKVALEVPCE